MWRKKCNFASEMATKRLKHRYVQTIGIIVMVLALVRCAFPGIAGKMGQQQAKAEADTLATEKVVAEQAKATEQEKATDQKTVAKQEKATDQKTVAKQEKAAEPGIVSAPITAAAARTRYIQAGERPHPIMSVKSYAEAFPDSNHMQLVAARQWGVTPVKDRADAEKRLGEVVYIGTCPYYDMAHLDASIPYLVPRASILLQDIGRAFFDSLQVKGLPLHRIVVSSVLRTEEDVTRLRRSNHNATEQSCHLYGTTFDINYNQYSPVTRRQVPNDKLKYVLSEVLDDLRRQGRCYIKYEVRQPCFHITVR